MGREADSDMDQQCQRYWCSVPDQHVLDHHCCLGHDSHPGRISSTVLSNWLCQLPGQPPHGICLPPNERLADLTDDPGNAVCARDSLRLATTPLRKTYGCLANASWTVIEGDGSEEVFTQYLRHALQFFAEAFSHITDKPCRASIKMTSWPNHGSRTSDVRVYTLCRSDDEQLEPASQYDQISSNTDFKQIFEENEAYFLCNDLPSEIGKGYQTHTGTLPRSKPSPSNTAQLSCGPYQGLALEWRSRVKSER